MGHFHDELERRRAALRALMPDTAAAIDAARAAFGPGVDCLGASEGGQTYRDPGAFARAWAQAGADPTHVLIEQSRALLRRYASRESKRRV